MWQTASELAYLNGEAVEEIDLQRNRTRTLTSMTKTRQNWLISIETVTWCDGSYYFTGGGVGRTFNWIYRSSGRGAEGFSQRSGYKHVTCSRDGRIAVIDMIETSGLIGFGSSSGNDFREREKSEPHLLALIQPDGEPLQLTQTGQAAWPSWSPDGELLVFVYSEPIGAVPQLATYVASRRVTVLTAFTEGELATPVLSDDGTVAFVRDEDIWLYRNGEVWQLTETESAESAPTWPPTN